MWKSYVLIPVALYLASHLHIATVTAEDSLFSSFSQLSSLSKQFKHVGLGGVGGESPKAAEGPGADSPAASPPIAGVSDSKFSMPGLPSLSNIGNLAKNFRPKIDSDDADAPSPSSDADAPSPSDDDDAGALSWSSNAGARSPSSDAGAPSPSSDTGAPSSSSDDLETNPLTSDDDDDKQ